MTITLHGFSWDGSSSYARGAELGPGVLRSSLWSEVSSVYSLSGVDVRSAIVDYDFQELPSDGPAVRTAIEARVQQTLSQGRKPLSVGGDHSISYPILKGLLAHHGPLNVLHIDAHPDLYSEFEGDRYSHACPFYRALEDGCIRNLVQVGLRSVTPEVYDYGQEKGVVMLSADDIERVPWGKLEGPLYISIDLDGFDPAFAPGVSHPEPGGLSSREGIKLIRSIPHSHVVGADVVELNPTLDVRLLTTHLAVRLVKELAAQMVAQ